MRKSADRQLELLDGGCGDPEPATAPQTMNFYLGNKGSVEHRLAELHAPRIGDGRVHRVECSGCACSEPLGVRAVSWWMAVTRRGRGVAPWLLIDNHRAVTGK
jgi:hypothetical protein